MPTNVEIKARAADWERQRARALCDGTRRLLQKDTFFSCASGRLKLREFGPRGPGQLIFYRRADGRAPKASRYAICPAATNDGDSLKTVPKDNGAGPEISETARHLSTLLR